MTVLEETELSSSRSLDGEISKSCSSPEDSVTPAPKRETKKQKLNITIFWEVTKKHALTIATAVIALIESIVLIKDLFQTTDVNEIGTYIAGESVFFFFLNILSIIIALFVLILSIIFARKDYAEQNKKVFAENDKHSIDNYLTNFIESGESVAILTHDMSWINDDNRKMLERKSKNRELLLFLPYETAQVKELEELGADVRYFGKIISDPANALVKSRMSIINWNKAFPKVTYPIKKDGLHINYEINCGEPANQLALDLVQLLILISEKGAEKNSIDSLLNEYINNPTSESYRSLNYYDYIRIETWFKKYTSSQPFSIKKAFDLMRSLSSYEDIDMKPFDEFMRISGIICGQYGIVSEKFVNMYMDFRKLLLD